MSNSKYIKFAVSIFIMILVCGCKEFNPPSRKIIIDPESKFTYPIRTEFNPVVIGKFCTEPTNLRIRVPKPYPNNWGRMSNRRNKGDSTHFVHILLDSVTIGIIPIDDDFTVTRDGKKFQTGYKYIDFLIPEYTSKYNESGTITIKLFSDKELITSYSTKYHYLENNDKINVIKRNKVKLNRSNGPLALPNYHNSYTIKEAGNYRDDIVFSHKLEKLYEYYLSTYTAKGNFLYMQDNKDKWKKVMEIPELPILTSKIPLGFELEEKFISYSSVYTSHIEQDVVGKQVIFVSFDEVIGSEMLVQFNDCQMTVLEDEEVYIKVHTGFKIER